MSKVILVMIDALGFESAWDRCGYLGHLVEIKKGAAYRVRGELPAQSRPMYETVLTGLPASVHGICTNAYTGASTSSNLFSIAKAHKKTTAAAAYLVTTIPFFLLIVCFMVTPLANLVINSLKDPQTGAFTLENYRTVFTKLLYQTAIWNSVRLALISTAIGIVIAFLTAMAITELGYRARKNFMPILNMTQNFTGFPLAFAFMILVGNSGFLVLLDQKCFGGRLFQNYNLYSGNGLLPLFVYFAIPLGTLLLIPSFSAIRKEWKEAAELMQASQATFWTKVGIPVLMPGICGTIGMLFADALTTYTTVYMIMSTNFPTLPIKISFMFSGDMKQQVELGSALSVVMICIILLAMGLSGMARNWLAKGRSA